jgi:thiosulfate dehydrogenase [quinone] large subunit
MDSSTDGGAPLPSDPRPARALAALRIAVGAWFVKTVVTKLGITLLHGVVPVPAPTARWVAFLPTRLHEYAAGNPIGWYRDFLLEVAIPHAHLFAGLTAFGEAAVGIGLVSGFLTRSAAALGAFLALSYLLACGWMSPNQLGFHLLLIACMTCFFVARAGLCWGVDGWLARRAPARTTGLGLRPAAA